MTFSVGECKLHCYEKANTYMLVGTVEDGTHCDKDSGVCILGVCHRMPKYFPPTEAPPTDASGKDMVLRTATGDHSLYMSAQHRTAPHRTAQHISRCMWFYFSLFQALLSERTLKHQTWMSGKTKFSSSLMELQILSSPIVITNTSKCVS